MRNVSAKAPTTQEMDGKAFRVFTAVSHSQSSYVSLLTIRILKVCKQNGGLQEMPLNAGIAQHAHRAGQRQVHKQLSIFHYFILHGASMESQILQNAEICDDR